MKVIQVSNDKERAAAFLIRQKVFVEEQKVPLEEEIDSFEDEALHFVAYHNDKPVGAGRLRLFDHFGKVERVCVLQQARGTGAGRALMETIEASISAAGKPKAKLNAQCQAEEFYQKLGYETISDQFLDAGIPHVTMLKTVN